MDRRRSKLVPHELRPANTAQSTIEHNRLSSELKKLERDKKTNISQLTASQVVLQKSLRAMVTGGQKSAQDVTDTSQTGPSPVPSLLTPHAGSSRLRVDGTPRSSSRLNVIMADPDALATKSTKSFSNQIIGGQAQLVRKLESNRNVRMSQSSFSSSTSRLTRSSIGMIMYGSLYNVPEVGAVTGVEFTEEDVEQGVHDFHPEEEPPAYSEPQQPTQADLGPSVASDVALPTLAEAGTSELAAAEAPELAAGRGMALGTAAETTKSGEFQLAVPEAPAAPRSEPGSPEVPPSVIESSPDRSVASSRPETTSARARALGRLSRSSRISSVFSVAPSPIALPVSISEQVYTRAVERAFANKCLKHSKFVTDLEMNEFVTKYLLVEQQNENFRRANEFVSRIVDSPTEL